MGNPFVHIELATGDVAAPKKFYKKVFDWKFNALGSEMGNYTMIDTGSKTVGGGMMAKMAEQPTAWMAYAEVDSVKKTIAKADKNGAKIIIPFHEIPGMGAFGIMVDPTGAAIGVWEKAKKPAKKGAKKAAKK